MSRYESSVSHEIEKFNLGKYIEELETDGLTIVPPEVTGVAPELIDRCAGVLLERFTELTGCPITVEDGPLKDLVWPEGDEHRFLSSPEAPDPTQVLLQQLLLVDRCFRYLALKPVVDVLVNHLMGEQTQNSGRTRRLSSANSFIKWPGEFGYGPGLGLHCDQVSNPFPWGRTALTANVTWALTDYSGDGGALA